MITNRAIILAALLLLGMDNALGQQQVVSWDEVAIDVTPAKTSFVLGEPATLNIRVKNNGKQPTVLHTADMGIEYETISVRISGPKSDASEYRTWSVIEPSKPAFALQPGESRSFTQLLHWNAATDRPAFPRPGQYAVEVSIPNLTGASDLVAKPVSVTIESGGKDVNKEMQELMLTRHMAGVLVGAAEPDDAFVKRLTQLTEQYPKARLTPYLHYALGNYYSRSFFKRQADPERAAQQFDRALKLIDANHPLRFELLTIDARQALRTGKVQRANQLLAQAKKIRPDSVELLPLAAAIDRRRQFDKQVR